MAARRKLVAQIDQMDLFDRPRKLKERAPASPLDERFGNLMVRLNGQPNEPLRTAAVAVSSSGAFGHTCLHLSAIDQDVKTLANSLKATRVVGSPGEFRPLILDQSGRLYLYRYWKYEQELAREIRQRAEALVEIFPDRTRTFLDQAMGCGVSDQRRAVETALTRRFCVITGGPGTGKTRTIGYIVAALIHLEAGKRAPRIAIAAPTGKAAARITESLRGALPESDADQLPEAVTLHRLLGAAGDLSKCRHNRSNPIPADVVIVDESSMIDLALMCHLVDAVRRDARLILLGDKDQLASVDAGNVFGDICDSIRAGSEVHEAGYAVRLTKSFRFDPLSGIQKLASAVAAGKTSESTSLFSTDRFSDLRFITSEPGDAASGRIRDIVVAGYGPVLKAPDATAALALLNRFRILCAVRAGPFGTEALNRLTETALAEEGLPTLSSRDYKGRPILILENDYNLRVFNGDVGILWPSEASPHTLMACFQTNEGEVRHVLPSRLPRHETAWAMTVHKSQGSEFDDVLFVLPSKEVPILTRELTYTAVTRCRHNLTIYGSPAQFQAGVLRSMVRASGLRDALAGI